MAGVTDCLIQLQKLTQQNLDILQAINDAFLSNKNHLSVKIGEDSYAIPSFISLENKINNLQENFENLINAPKTGEAYFNFDGNSRAIEVRGYTHTPHSITLNNVDGFEVEHNDIFKDFLTPVPYVKFSVENIPNDIISVNVKKIIPKTNELKEVFNGLLNNSNSSQQSYSELYKKLSLYKEDVDFVEYDTIKKLPIRKNIGSGTYVIESIINDYIDENLDEYITIRFRNNIDNSYDESYTNKLSYKLFDETLEKNLKVGDCLVTYDDSAKMIITEIQQNTNTITFRVLNGEYLNLLPSDLNDINPVEINDLSKLKFFSPIDFNNDKYIKVPLEEDQYVFIAIAPINDRMNIQSSWGTGVIVNTYRLLSNDNEKFEDYYKNNVMNIGDTLNELIYLSPGSLTKMNGDDFNNITNIIPTINEDHLSVVQINKHLNDSVAVKNIRTLYSQKLKYNSQLTEIQAKIDDINSKLSEVSYDDTSNIRSIYVSQLTDYNKTKNELVTSITKIIDEISLAANSSDVPIENAKYHIRGFFDIVDFEKQNDNLKDHIKGIKVQYRYKNLDNTQGTATTIADKFLFSDWNDMPGFLNPKLVSYEKGDYIFNLQKDTSNQNIPSFNQIDIPISQGETVDIRLKVIYDYGYPYAEVSSQWSEIVNIEFPKEYLKNIQILDIISENNSDIETNRFQNILKEQGIPSHIEDKIQDQDITYFHKPENIASGYYTAERRIVPLRDKLEELTNELASLKSLVTDSNSDALRVSLSIGDTSVQVLPNQSNSLLVEAYDKITDDSVGYSKDEAGVVSVPISLVLHNPSNLPVKMYPLFPGYSDTELNNITNYKYNPEDYTYKRAEGKEFELSSSVIRYYLQQFGEDTFIDFNVLNNLPQTNTYYIKCLINSNNDGIDIPYQKYDRNNAVLLRIFETVDNLYLLSTYDKDNESYSLPISTMIKKKIDDSEYFCHTKAITFSQMIFPGKDKKYHDFTFEGKKYFIEDDIKNENLNIGLHKYGTLTFNNGIPETFSEVGQVFVTGVYNQIYVVITKVESGQDVLQKSGKINNVLYENGGVWMQYKDNITTQSKIQTMNQFLTFRVNDIYTNKYYYSPASSPASNDLLSVDYDFYILNEDGACLYPFLNDKNGLCIKGEEYNGFEKIDPGHSIVINLLFKYKLKGLSSIRKTMSFDVRTSLYKDPINYTFSIVAKQSLSDIDKALVANNKSINDTKYSTIVIK